MLRSGLSMMVRSSGGSERIPRRCSHISSDVSWSAGVPSIVGGWHADSSLDSFLRAFVLLIKVEISSRTCRGHIVYERLLRFS